MTKEDLKIGMEAIGFKFKGVAFVDSMNKYIDSVGKIVEISKTNVRVKFEDGHSWWYPIDQLLEQSNPIDLCQLFNEIQNL